MFLWVNYVWCFAFDISLLFCFDLKNASKDWRQQKKEHLTSYNGGDDL